MADVEPQPQPQVADLIPGLPEEIALECFTRLHYSTLRVATQVCRRWRGLLRSLDFYHLRKQNGATHKAACLVQSLPVNSGSDELKPVRLSSYGVTVFDPETQTWDRVDPIPQFPDGLPLFCKLCSSQGKLVVMGGWDPLSYNPVSDVFVYEFTTRRWSRGKEMPDKRSFFAACELNGWIIIAGGHDESKNALSSAWGYEARNDEWNELTRMSQQRDECEGVVVGSELWVVSGYKTESQGVFEGSGESYDMETGAWKRVDDMWKPTQCPISCVGVGKDGKLFCWAESASAIGVGTCTVQLGKWTLVSGSAYQGGQQVFFMAEGQSGKFEKLVVPAEYKGFVQTGCCVEI